MLGITFETGSLLHISSLTTCALLAYLVVRLSRTLEKRERGHIARRFVGFGCIAAWITNTTYHLLPGNFNWENGLPLHFCNFANLLGAAALLARKRIFQSLLYFWTLGMSIWAFLTPTLDAGPDDIDFWVFWSYHFFILMGLVYVLVIDRFQPRLTDLKHAVLVTGAYTAVLIVVDYAFKWNYGFLGPSSPSQPTPIDILGPYPFRLIYLVLGVAVVFTLLLLPWKIAGNGSTGTSDPLDEDSEAQ